MGRKLKEVSLNQITEFLNKMETEYEVYGNLKEKVSGFSALTKYQEHTLTWVKSVKKDFEIPSNISICIVQKGIEIKAGTQIVTDNSKLVFFSIVDKFWGNVENQVNPIGEGTVISKDVHLGKNVHIGCNCSIRGDISIGDNTTIGDNVVIKNNVTIGKNCDIQSLTVIGEDGYGYYEDELQVKTMIKHFGGVFIGDNVFIGSHTNIARGTIGDTVIGKGVKIAPSTHIGNNNYIGENASIVCSQLFGSVEIGENAYVSSSVIRNQIKVNRNVVVGMGSVVTKDIEENKVVFGIPAKVIRENSGNEKL